MIELFDAKRLERRRDLSLPAFALVLAVGTGSLSAWGWSLQGQWRQAEAQRAALASQLQKKPARPVPAALLADLERQAQLLETRLGADETPPQLVRPSAWLQRLASIGSAGISLTRVEVDRTGAAHVEGLAVDAAAANGFVQAFARDEAPSALHARSIDLRQDKAQAPYLRFSLRASSPGASRPDRPMGGPTVEAAASAPPTRVAVNKP